MSEEDLFGRAIRQEFGSPAKARHDNPLTSKVAAKSCNTSALEMQVLSVIKTFGANGCTQDELLDVMGHELHGSVTPRMRPLAKKGFITFEGSRAGRSGKQQRVIKAL